MRSFEVAWRSAKDDAALAAILAGYWASVFPLARRELAHWRACAEGIPDARVRALALGTLAGESGLAEGAALFATLVPGRTARRRLVRLLVAWQVAYDYLDTVGEASGADGYAVLARVLDPAARSDARAPDDAYLDDLLACCRACLAALPSLDAVGPAAVRAAARCAEAQALTHAVATSGPEPLRRWALAQRGADRFLWWEIAAGGISSLAVHALLATAALPRATAAEATRVDAAYFPSICALSTLLDSTIDASDDAGTSNHRSTEYYADPAQAAARVAAIARSATSAARTLPRGRAHAVILAGMTAHYAASGWGGNERTHRRVASVAGPGARTIRWMLRLRALSR